MKLLLITGGMHEIISNSIIKNNKVINEKSLKLKDLNEFLQEVNPDIDNILITDEAFSCQTNKDKQDITLLLEWLGKNQKTKSLVKVITKDFMTAKDLEDLCNRYSNLEISTYDLVRIPQHIFVNAFINVSSKKTIKTKVKKKELEKSPNKKKSFLERFRTKPKEDNSGLTATDKLTKEFENISRGISRIVAITGHRGAGLTSTVVNVASEATKRGLSAIIIDMDIDYRSTNMYFSSFHEQANKDEDINASLIRTFAKPQDYMTTSFNLKGNLWLTSLGYGFKDNKLISQFYNSNKLVGLLSVLRSKFNLVILDMPLDLSREFKEALIHIDTFGLCVSNNLYSVLSTLRNIEVTFDKESISYLNAKSKSIITKYSTSSTFQKEIFTPEKVNEVLTSGLSENFIYEMKLAGQVPYNDEFDIQIESDVPLVNTSAEHEKAYGNILLRLMEGAK